MNHLLHVSRLQTKALSRKGTVPLMLEFGVAEETAPYLVSSSSSVMWVTEPHPGPSVKAAIREVSLTDFFREVVEAVAVMGRLQKWGNVQPLTMEGLKAAIDHVAFYGLDPLELIIPRVRLSVVASDDDDDQEDPQWVGPVSLMPPEIRPLIEGAGLPFRASAWVPEGTVVVVPKDRSFVGMVSQVTPKKIAGVVHNAARGLAIVRGDFVPDEVVPVD